MIPSLDGENMLHFTNAGLYDGLFVMQDTETNTLWNHISGQAMYGELYGESLSVYGVLLQTTVEQALEMDPDMRVAISGRPFANSGPGFTPTSFGRGGRGEAPEPGASGPGRGARGGPEGGGREGRGAEGGPPAGPDPDAQLMDMFAVTLGAEDTRRDRMEMGLGIWNEDISLRRFYPFDRIRERGAFIDRVEGRNLLVYFDPVASVPAAIFVDADEATLHGREVRLNNGRSVVTSQLVDANGDAIAADRPNQVFTRWYGFSLTFPSPEIYEE